jgi:hypothetical protein
MLRDLMIRLFTGKWPYSARHYLKPHAICHKVQLIKERQYHGTVDPLAHWLGEIKHEIIRQLWAEREANRVVLLR